MEDFSPGGSAEKGSMTRYLTLGLKATHFLMLVHVGLFAVVSLSRGADEADRSAGRLEPAELFMAESSMALLSFLWCGRLRGWIRGGEQEAEGWWWLIADQLSSYLRCQDNVRSLMEVGAKRAQGEQRHNR